MGTGTILHCPTSHNCTLCELTCDGNDCCNGAVIYGYHCDLVFVDFYDGHRAGRAFTAYAPDNGGNLVVQNSNQNRRDVFRGSRVYSAPNTNDILISILGGDGSQAGELQDVVINGTTANYLGVTCYNYAHCDNVTLYCPNKNGGNVACSINCTDAEECSGNAYIWGEQWDDEISVYCPTASNVSCDIMVHCDDIQSCTMTGSNICDGGDAQCQPFLHPTFAPTPTRNNATGASTPSISTAIPAEITTENPTQMSTEIATSHPSAVLIVSSTTHTITQITTTSSIVINIKSPKVFNKIVLLAIIAIIAVSLCVCMISLFFCCHKRLQAEKQRRELEIKEFLQKSLADLASKEIASNSTRKDSNQSA